MVDARGNRTQAAEALGIQRTYLLRLIRELSVTVAIQPGTKRRPLTIAPKRCGHCRELGHTARNCAARRAA